MLFQKVQQRYTHLINTIYFRSFIIDQSWNTLQLKDIVLSFHPPFEPINALLQLQVCDLNSNCTKTIISVITRNILITHDPSRKKIHILV